MAIVRLYDDIGHGYGRTRRPDPRIAAAIDAALGDAETVLNVGAGTGAYEPVGPRGHSSRSRPRVMLAQRPRVLRPPSKRRPKISPSPTPASTPRSRSSATTTGPTALAACVNCSASRVGGRIWST